MAKVKLVYYNPGPILVGEKDIHPKVSMVNQFVEVGNKRYFVFSDQPACGGELRQLNVQPVDAQGKFTHQT